MATNIKCYCGKWLDDKSHRKTHVDKFLTEAEFQKLNLEKIVQVRVRLSREEPWRYVLSKRIGKDYYMIGLYQP